MIKNNFSATGKQILYKYKILKHNITVYMNLSELIKQVIAIGLFKN